VNSNSKEEIKITAEKVTNSYGTYQLEIPAMDGFQYAAAGMLAAESICRAAVLDNPSVHATRRQGPPRSSTSPSQARTPTPASTAQLPLLPPQQAGLSRDASPLAELNTSLFYCPPAAVAVATHPVLHAAPVVPAHPVLHAAANGVPVPAATNPVLHPAGVPFPFPAAAVIPVPSLTFTLLAATAVACVPIPNATASTPTSCRTCHHCH
jgi:hypothetical protein